MVFRTKSGKRSMLTLTKEKSFSEFKKNFYEKFPDLNIFDTDDFNATKIILDALKVNYASKYNRTAYLFLNPFCVFIRYMLCYLKYYKFLKSFKTYSFNTECKILFFDFSKNYTIGQNQRTSFIYDSIIYLCNPSDIQYFYAAKIQTDSPPDKLNINNFYYMSYLYDFFEYTPLRKEIRKLYHHLKSLNILSKRDLKNIRIALQNFYERVIIYDHIFRKFPRAFIVVMNQHYHNEALIYSARKRKIRIVEVQHGLISENDIFYVFPKCVEKIRLPALFPDEIWVYGTYWKNILSRGFEYDKEKIFIVGDVRKHKINSMPSDDNLLKIKNFLNNCKGILITTQTFMHNEYIEYILFLVQEIRKNYNDYKIIVKLHPNENIQDYKPIYDYSEIFLTQHFPLNNLFENIQIHISVYSTTLFDARNYSHVLNFSLESEVYEDYHRQMVIDRVAYPLKRNEFPTVNTHRLGYELLSKECLFSRVDENLIKMRLYDGM